MKSISHRSPLVVLLLGLGAAAAAQQSPVPVPGSPPAQTQEDDYTRYELLAPESAQFRIEYEVTATTPGARFFFNVIRRGSEATDEAVYDLMTGAALPFEVVTGARAKADGLTDAALDTSYIRIALPRPVPDGGGVRLRIDKTYKDARSYYRQGDLIVFDRPLSISRNAVVLPPGYELASLNVPSQIATEEDGRIRVSFMNATPAPMPLVVKARRLPPASSAATSGAPGAAHSANPVKDRAVQAPASTNLPTPDARLVERARQDREIVYFLQQPETHAFSLYHDYTESREGVDKYLNVVRQGSTVSNPSARILDTGEALRCEILKGTAITQARIDIGEAVRPDTEVVVIRFAPVRKGQSVRLRIEETYTDPGRFGLDGGELAWDRALGRPRNSVVLPTGWLVTASSIPATVSELPDGRVRLDYWNPRPDEVAVLLKARRRPR